MGASVSIFLVRVKQPLAARAPHGSQTSRVASCGEQNGSRPGRSSYRASAHCLLWKNSVNVAQKNLIDVVVSTVASHKKKITHRDGEAAETGARGQVRVAVPPGAGDAS